jgi:hypothetical protein
MKSVCFGNLMRIASVVDYHAATHFSTTWSMVVMEDILSLAVSSPPAPQYCNTRFVCTFLFDEFLSSFPGTRVFRIIKIFNKGYIQLNMSGAQYRYHAVMLQLQVRVQTKAPSTI